MIDWNYFSRNVKENIARGLLMTGPRATPPTHRAIRKAVRRLNAGGTIKGSWRSWPNNEGKENVD